MYLGVGLTNLSCISGAACICFFLLTTVSARMVEGEDTRSIGLTLRRVGAAAGGALRAGEGGGIMIFLTRCCGSLGGVGGCMSPSGGVVGGGER